MELETGDGWKMSISEVKASQALERVLEDTERSQVVKTDGSLEVAGGMQGRGPDRPSLRKM